MDQLRGWREADLEQLDGVRLARHLVQDLDDALLRVSILILEAEVLRRRDERLQPVPQTPLSAQGWSQAVARSRVRGALRWRQRRNGERIKQFPR